MLTVVPNMGKGSKRRPEKDGKYQENWEKIFGDKKKRVQERRTRKQQKNI